MPNVVPLLLPGSLDVWQKVCVEEGVFCLDSTQIFSHTHTNVGFRLSLVRAAEGVHERGRDLWRARSNARHFHFPLASQGVPLLRRAVAVPIAPDFKVTHML